MDGTDENDGAMRISSSKKNAGADPLASLTREDLDWLLA